MAKNKKGTEDTVKMTKCEFCEFSTPKGKCKCDIKSLRSEYCEIAIYRMTKCLIEHEMPRFE